VKALSLPFIQGHAGQRLRFERAVSTGDQDRA
jgi:hypothetical protein